MKTLNITRIIALGAFAFAAACSASDEFNPANIPGDYTLTQVNGRAVPYPLTADSSVRLWSGRITLNADGSYTARTCYAAGCEVERPETGRYTIDGASVSLFTLDGYTRTLQLEHRQLIERGGGDFECDSAADRAAGRVCYVLTYTRQG